MSSVVNSIKMNEKNLKNELIELSSQLNVKTVKENEKKDEKKTDCGEILKLPNNETDKNSQIEDQPGHSTPINKETSNFRSKIRLSEIPKYGMYSVVNNIKMNEKIG
ncbi:hypothetical protein PV325_004725 [Microctonus aethiopoides]|nr:hypothetical protein PV325_004725 [Microctonus aethiopoides]